MSKRRNIRRRKILKIGAFSGAGALTGLAGCTGGTDGGDDGETTTEQTTTTTTAAPSDDDTVKIGFLHPLSGAFAGLGEAQQKGARVALQHVNDAGGINGRTLEGFYEDTESDPSTGREKARRHAEVNEVDVLIGGVSGAVGLAVSEFAANNDLPYFTGASAEQITTSDCKQNTFRYQTSASQAARAGAPWALDRFGENVWIHYADYSYGVSVRDTWQAAMEAADANVNVVDVTSTPVGTTDFSSYISQMAASDADWILQAFSGADAINFLKQATQYGLKENKAIMSPVNSFRPIRIGAGEAAVGTYGPFRYYHNFDTDANGELNEAFSAMHGEPPDDFAHVMWSSLRLYAKGANEAGSVETSDVVPALEGLESDEPMGTTQLRECDHQALRPYPVGEIVAPTDYYWPSLEIEDVRPAEEVILPCEETGCSF